MTRLMRTAWLATWVLLSMACDKDNDLPKPVDPLIVEDHFEENTQNWQGGFSDYPEGEEDFYELDFGHSTLPPPLDTTAGALKITGNNHSDDLFMFVYKPVEGLAPNTNYHAFFDLTIASDAADDSFGVGSSPAHSVYLKAGVVRVKPTPQVGDQGFYWMNIDKGNQSQDGEQMMNIGDVANGTDQFEYALIKRRNDQPFSFRTGSDGDAWLIIGTDSGFESTTTLYFDHIEVRLEKAD